jgi:hypothetical protein
MKSTTVVIMVAVVLAGAVASCRRSAKSPSPPAGAVPSSQAEPSPPPLEASQRDRLNGFGEQLARLINDGKLNDLVRLLNIEALIEAAFAGVDWKSHSEVRGFYNGFVRSLHDDPVQLLRQLDGGEAKFLRIRETPRGTAVLVRCILRNGASTYFDVYPRFDADGTIGIREFYNHATGLTVLEAFRSVVLVVVPGLDVSFLEKVFTGRQKIDPQVFMEFAAALKTKDAARAKAAFPKLSDEARRSRPIFMSYLQVLMQDPDDPAYLAALEHGQQLYPGDPTLDFLAIDLHLLKKNYPAYDAAIRRIEDRLGRDAHLLTLRAAGLIEAKDYSSAQPVVAEAIALEPDFKNGYRLQLKLAILQRDYAAACATLDELKKRFAGRWRAPDPESGQPFKDFADSPEYHAWLARHSSKQTPPAEPN